MTAATERTYIRYPGHLGPEARYDLCDHIHTVRLTAGEIRPLPPPDASDLVTVGGCQLLLTLVAAAKRFGTTQKQLRRIGEIVRHDQETLIVITPELAVAIRGDRS